MSADEIPSRDEQISKRFEELFLTAGRFCDHFLALDGCASSLHVSSQIVYLTAVSVHDEIIRYKDYHLDVEGGQRSDVVKRAAYSVYWINKLRPLQLAQENDGEVGTPNAGRAVMANQEFALTVARFYIEAEANVEFLYSDVKHAGLLYDLTYREIGRDGLLAIYQDTVDLVLGQSVICAG